MRTLWKYPITEGQMHITTPPGAKLRAVGEASGLLCAWFEVETGFDGHEEHLLWTVPTGGKVPDLARYVDTVVDHRGYVWHVFDTLTPELAERILARQGAGVDDPTGI